MVGNPNHAQIDFMTFRLHYWIAYTEGLVGWLVGWKSKSCSN
jgi:hypothetical protein